MFIWVSNHIIAKPDEDQKDKHVDVAGIGGRKLLLPGEAQTSVSCLIVRESAEAIVVGEYELRTDTAEGSQNNEGLNVKLFQMLQGGILPALY